MHYNYQLAMAVVNVKYIIKRSRSLFLTIIVSILNFRRKCLKILKYACSKFYKTRIFFYQSFTIFDKKSSRGQKLNFERSIVTILSVLAILAKRLRKRRDIHDPPGSGERGGKRAKHTVKQLVRRKTGPRLTLHLDAGAGWFCSDLFLEYCVLALHLALRKNATILISKESDWTCKFLEDMLFCCTK